MSINTHRQKQRLTDDFRAFTDGTKTIPKITTRAACGSETVQKPLKKLKNRPDFLRIAKKFLDFQNFRVKFLKFCGQILKNQRSNFCGQIFSVKFSKSRGQIFNFHRSNFRRATQRCRGTWLSHPQASLLHQVGQARP